MHGAAASPDLQVLRGAEVFAPEPLGPRDLLLAGGKIVAVAASLPALPPALATEHDVRGLRLVPGLIDAHVHLIGGGGEAGPHTRVPPVTLTQLSRAGITTVVGVLGTDGTTRSVADLVARTLGLRLEGLSAYCYTGSYELPVPTLTGSVRRDLVFVDPILGVGELAISDHRSSQPTLDELLRVAADAHVGGMMSGKAGIVHLHMGDGVRGFDLIRRKLNTLVEREGVVVIDATGAFDPNLHEAISHEPSDTVPSGHIIAEVRRGYRLNDRVLRPSYVRVAI